MANVIESGEFRVAVASKSPLKLNAVEKAAQAIYPSKKVIVLGFDIPSRVAEQPIGGETIHGALNRLEGLEEQTKGDEIDAYAAIENGVFRSGSRYIDFACIAIENSLGERVIRSSLPVVFPTEDVIEARQLGFTEHTVGGITAKKITHEHSLPQEEEDRLSKDPHSWLTQGKFTRESLLFEGAEKALEALFDRETPPKIPYAEYRDNRALIIGRFYGPHTRTVKRAAGRIAQAGYAVYPEANTPAKPFQSSTRENTDFYFLGEKAHGMAPAQIQADVFSQMLNLNISGKICYVAIHQGYIGESTSIEMTYAISQNVPIVLLESKITKYSDKTPPFIREIIEANHKRYPVILTKELNADTIRRAQRVARAVNPAQLTEEQHGKATDEAIKLIQRLGIDYSDYSY